MKSNPPPDPLCEAPRDLYTVTEISEAVRQHLESEFPRVSVIGEIANFKIHSSGHVYFTLRDSASSIHAVLFRRYAERITCSPENGMLVIAPGRISHFGGSGQTQLIATDMIPSGRGDMELEVRRLLRRLMEEGLTAVERKRMVAPYPSKIAVITSPTGAVVRDIVDTLRRRWPVAEIVHIPTEVQGPGAARAIVRAFETANGMDDVDTVILARGGGSIEDLRPFNLEEVARAVAASAHPVITGIGHEIDTTVADYVADIRAATPTAAAELAAPSVDEVARFLAAVTKRIELLGTASVDNKRHLIEYCLRSAAFPAIAHRIEREELEMDALLERILSGWEERYVATERDLERCVARIEDAANDSLAGATASLDGLAGRLVGTNPVEEIRVSRGTIEHLARMTRMSISSAVALRRKEIAGKTRALEALDPRGVLRRGYAVCTTPDDAEIIPRVEAVATGCEMTVHFHDGAARCAVRGKRKGTPWRKKRVSKRPSSGSMRS
jgi:exodeoxyribonuclease VII large subunit